MDTSFYNLFANVQGVFWVIVFFGGSIFIHELGHFLAARACGLRVERFSIGFGPKVFSWQRNEVEYCVSLIPFGGYVALPDFEHLDDEEDNEFHRRKGIPYVSQLLVLSMGALFNLLFAAFLAGILWILGQPMSEAEATTTIGYIVPQIVDGDNSPALKAGLQPGDRVLEVDGHEVETFSEILNFIVTGKQRNAQGEPFVMLKIQRGETIFDQNLTPKLSPIYPGSEDFIRRIGIQPAYKIKVAELVPHALIANQDLQKGDEILEVEGIPLLSLSTLSDHLRGRAGEPLDFKIQRNGEYKTLQLMPMERVYTQPLLKLKSGEKFIEFLPINSTNTLIAATDVLNALIVFNKSTQDLIPGVIVGDKILGFGDLKNALTLENAEKEFQKEGVQIMLDRRAGDFELIRMQEDMEVLVVASKTQTILGFICEMPQKMVHVSIWDQFKKSFVMTFNVLESLLSRGSDIGLHHLMGPPGMMRTLHNFSKIDFRLLLNFVVLMNVNLAILNLLPIPVLDGGHILFATIERLRRKRLPISLLRRIQQIFMILLFGMMLYVSFFDIRRWALEEEQEQKAMLLRDYFIE